MFRNSVQKRKFKRGIFIFCMLLLPLAQFAVFFFQRHLRGDSGLKFGMETTGLRQKLGFLFQKGQYLRFELL